MSRKHFVGLMSIPLIVASFSSLAEPESQAVHERIIAEILKPCEGKKAGDKVMIIDRRGGQHEAICTLTAVPLPE